MISRHRPWAAVGTRGEVCWLPELHFCVRFAFSSWDFRSETFKWNLPVLFPTICILKPGNTSWTRSFVRSCDVYYFLRVWVSGRVVQLVVCCGAVFACHLPFPLCSLHLVKKKKSTSSATFIRYIEDLL